MLVCLHEEHVVAIAHGYAKVTGKPLLGDRAQQRRPDARVDGGLQRMVRSHAGDPDRRDRSGRRGASGGRGSTGSTRRATRRALVRGFVKWDDQPASVAAAFESLLRARQIARDGAQGPGVCLPRRVRCRKRSSPRCRSRPDPCALSCRRRRRTRRRSSSHAPREWLAQREAAADPHGPRVARRRGAGTRASRSPRSWTRRC